MPKECTDGFFLKRKKETPVPEFEFDHQVLVLFVLELLKDEIQYGSVILNSKDKAEKAAIQEERVNSPNGEDLFGAVVWRLSREDGIEEK
ncbi:hypothetical protein SUGI_0998580 [Cryptomeria japonica]|nr:hypothetical protein SUGI_0998580 [Cryptomeria japonica]